MTSGSVQPKMTAGKVVAEGIAFDIVPCKGNQRYSPDTVIVQGRFEIHQCLRNNMQGDQLSTSKNYTRGRVHRIEADNVGIKPDAKGCKMMNIQSDKCGDLYILLWN